MAPLVLDPCGGGQDPDQGIPAAAVPQTEEQIAEYRRFRRLIRALVEVSKKVCNDQLQSPQAVEASAAKKGAKVPSLPRSKR
ncbi:MAG: hypothetical protein WBH61_12650 [Candidatus Methylomirabilis sp.]|jgi:hypothetical protein